MTNNAETPQPEPIEINEASEAADRAPRRPPSLFLRIYRAAFLITWGYMVIAPVMSRLGNGGGLSLSVLLLAFIQGFFLALIYPFLIVFDIINSF